MTENYKDSRALGSRPGWWAAAGTAKSHSPPSGDCLGGNGAGGVQGHGHL